MLQRFIMMFCAALLPALMAQAETVVVQPNLPADVSAAQPAPAKTESAGNKPFDKTPVFAAPAAKTASPAPVATLAPAVDPKEKLPLGPAAGTAAAAAGKKSGDGGLMWMLTTLAALGVVIALILLLRAFIAKATGRSPASAQSPVIEVLSRTTIAPRNHVLLIRMGQRILVVGDSASGMTTLANIGDPEEVASLLQMISAGKPGSSSAGFTKLLADYDGQYDDPRLADEGTDVQEHKLDRARDRVSGLLSRMRNMSGKGGEA